MKHAKIAIIGVGRVGATTAYTLLLQNIAAEILIVDINQDLCKGEVLDLSDVLSFSATSKIKESSYQEAAQADIIIITAGTAQKPGQTRTELNKINKKIIDTIAENLQPINKRALIIMVSNPVDTMTLCLQEKLNLPRAQIFGSGTFLDSQRLHGILARKIGVAEQSIYAFILGEHGDTQFPAWSTALIAGKPILDFPEIEPADLTIMAKQVKRKAYEIIASKGATFYGIASCLGSICQAIVFDQKKVMPLSCYQEKFGVALSLPTIIGEKGIEKIESIHLNKQEEELLKKSAEKLIQVYQACDN